MDQMKIIETLGRIARELDKCADDVPYELSAKNNLYFRMVDAAKEAREIIENIKHSSK
jgi:hypothetical protein